MTITRIVLEDSLTAEQLIDHARLSTSVRPAVLGLADHLTTLAAGINDGKLTLQVGATRATATVTFTGAPAANETITIGNVVLTAKASGAVADQFNIGGTVTLTAAALAACINASTNLSGIVTATSAVGVVTITAVAPGKTGSAIQLSEGLTNATATQFTAAIDGTRITLDRS